MIRLPHNQGRFRDNLSSRGQGLLHATVPLQAVSGSLADDIFYDDIYVEEDSFAFIASNLSGSAAIIPVQFTPAGQATSPATNGLNAIVDCSQTIGGDGPGLDCAGGVAAVGIDALVGPVFKDLDEIAPGLPLPASGLNSAGQVIDPVAPSAVVGAVGSGA